MARQQTLNGHLQKIKLKTINQKGYILYAQITKVQRRRNFGIFTIPLERLSQHLEVLRQT
jgi:hypothetical protein